jgi:CIC family chloride channel protein
MKHLSPLHAGIPIAPSLEPTLADEGARPRVAPDKKRLIRISLLAVLVAVTISLVARVLVWLINLVTNLFFHGELSVAYHSPADNHLGLWVVLLPAAGGLLVSLMALYGSKAIRGHGIPEAMEQILTNQSRIKPSIMYLKPLSAAISIGTGGPFGAEGPIIATGGALGSTLGQLISITHQERKVLLAAGATAGMSAIFGTPIAAVFLAIELLLPWPASRARPATTCFSSRGRCLSWPPWPPPATGPWPPTAPSAW